MFKGILKRLAAVLAIILIISVFFSACAKTTTTTPSASASGGTPSTTTSYKFGVNTWGSGVPALDKYGDNAEYVIKMLGSTTMRASDDFTPDKESANVQNFCSAGVSGITLQAAGVTNLLQMAQTCQTAKVPFVLNTFVGNDPDRTKIADGNPYYVGSIANDMYAAGKVVADFAIADGHKLAVVIGGNIGDNTQELANKGFIDEFTAKGGKVLSSARCTDPSQAPTKAEDMLSANKDATCLYAMVGDYVPGSLTAIKNVGLDGKITIYMSIIDKTSAGFIKDGTVKSGADGMFLASLIAPTLLLNYLDGHPIKDPGGKAPDLLHTPFMVDKSNIDAYMSIFCTDGVNPITDNTLKDLCWRYNPNVSYQTYVDFMKNLNLNELLKAAGKPTAG